MKKANFYRIYKIQNCIIRNSASISKTSCYSTSCSAPEASQQLSEEKGRKTPKAAIRGATN